MRAADPTVWAVRRLFSARGEGPEALNDERECQGSWKARDACVCGDVMEATFGGKKRRKKD